MKLDSKPLMSPIMSMQVYLKTSKIAKRIFNQQAESLFFLSFYHVDQFDIAGRPVGWPDLSLWASLAGRVFPAISCQLASYMGGIMHIRRTIMCEKF